MTARARGDLQAEYVLIQGQYEAFDQRALSMKTLATPLLGAGIAFGAKEGGFAVLIATVVVAASLWLLEAIWKGFQYCLSDRIRRLEAWFKGDTELDGVPIGEDEPVFQIYSAWGVAYARERSPRIFRRMAAPFVCLPYVVVIAVGAALILARTIRP